MAAAGKMRLIEASAVSASVTGEAMRAEYFYKNFVLFIKLSNRTAGTYDAKVQHSPDGTAWFDLKTFTQLTANGQEIVVVKDLTDGAVLAWLRGVITFSAGPGSADIIIDALFEFNK